MLQGSPTEELDRIIAWAQEAQGELRALVQGITPDDHGVVTSTVDVAGRRADELRAGLVAFEERGLAVADAVGETVPDSSTTYEELAALSRRVIDMIPTASVGHTGVPAVTATDPAGAEPDADHEAGSTSGTTSFYGA